MPTEDSVSHNVYKGFERHAKENGMLWDEMNRACVPYFTGAYEVLATDERKWLERMIANARKHGFASYRQLIQPI